MTIPLPKPIATFFGVANRTKTDNLTNCFTPDAIVIDEGLSHQGLDAIHTWFREARQKFEFTIQPVQSSLNGQRTIVTAKVIGNFPGSPILLEHTFRLDGDKICFLEIG